MNQLVDNFKSIKAFVSICVLMFAFSSISAQDWSLEKCIQEATDRSLTVKQSELTVNGSKLDVKAAKSSLMPNISASTSYNLNFGRSIDQTSNVFTTESFQSNNINLFGSLPLYNGLRIRNTIRQTNVNLAASLLEVEQVKNDLALNVAGAYLQVLLAEEATEALEEQNKQTLAQLDRTQKLIRAGSMPASAVLEIEAQIARNEQNLVNSRNNITTAYLTLKNLINLDPSFDLKIEHPEIPLPGFESVPELNVLYSKAVKNQPSIEANKLRESSAQYGVKIAKGSLQPSLSFSYGLNTNYSSVGRKVGSSQTFQFPIGSVEVPGTGVLPVISNPQTQNLFVKANYFEQISANVSPSFGLSLSIPIYNRNQSHIQIQRAEMGVKSAEYQSIQTKNQLKADIQRSILNAQAASQQYSAAEKSVNAFKLSFENAQKRFNLGAGTTYELTAAQNNLLVAENELLQAKYTYIFRIKILDFYEGKAINLK